MTFSELVKAFEDRGYEVEVNNPKVTCIYERFADLRGRGVSGWFFDSDGNDKSNGIILNNIQMDKPVEIKQDKPWPLGNRAALYLTFPENDDQIEELFRHVEHLGSDEGFELSKTVCYTNDTPYVYSKKSGA